jgi:ferredoxin
MKIEIDLLSCQDFGECALSAPNVFHLDENGKQSLRLNSDGTKVEFEADDQYRSTAEEAVIVCPMQALTILR